MNTKFRTVITTAGAAKLAAATAPGGRKVNITTMAVGDGGGKLPVPDAGQTGLIHEVWRHALNKISQDKRNYLNLHGRSRARMRLSQSWRSMKKTRRFRFRKCTGKILFSKQEA